MRECEGVYSKSSELFLSLIVIVCDLVGGWVGGWVSGLVRGCGVGLIQRE